MPQLLQWTKDFEICPLIDKQHRQLVEILNELHQAYLAQEAHNLLMDIIYKLKRYTEYHFKTEEWLFDQFGFKQTQQHKLEHELFKTKVAEFAFKFFYNKAQLTTEVLEFLSRWIEHHILKSDKEYKILCDKNFFDIHTENVYKLIQSFY